jgi:hypothetical protein
MRDLIYVCGLLSTDVATFSGVPDRCRAHRARHRGRFIAHVPVGLDPGLDLGQGVGG